MLKVIRQDSVAEVARIDFEEGGLGDAVVRHVGGGADRMASWRMIDGERYHHIQPSELDLLGQAWLEGELQEAGNWLHPSGKYVVYTGVVVAEDKAPRTIDVMYLTTGVTVRLVEGEPLSPGAPEWAFKVALTYFADHPEGPWSSAKPDETWYLEYLDKVGERQRESATVVYNVGGNPPYFRTLTGNRLGLKQPSIQRGVLLVDAEGNLQGHWS